MRKDTWLLCAKICAAVALAAAVWWFIRSEHLRHFTPQAVRDYVRTFGERAALVYVLAYALNTVSVFPPIGAVSLAAGLAFGKVQGALYLVCGSMIGTSITFWIARYFGRRTVERMLKGRYRDLDDKLARKGFWAVLFFRIVPLVPYEVLNYAGGLSRVKFRDYFFGTFLGLIPGIMASAFFGGSLTEIREFKDIFAAKFLLAFGLLAAVVAIPVCYVWWRRHAKKGDSQ